MQTALQSLLIALVLSGCGNSRWFREFEVDERGFDWEVMKKVWDETGLVFPEGTSGLNFRYRPGIDPSFIAKTKISREGREEMLKQIEAIKHEEIHISGGLTGKVSWWSPSKGTVIIDPQSHQSDIDYLRVILTEEESRTIL